MAHGDEVSVLKKDQQQYKRIIDIKHIKLILYIMLIPCEIEKTPNKCRLHPRLLRLAVAMAMEF